MYLRKCKEVYITPLIRMTSIAWKRVYTGPKKLQVLTGARTWPRRRVSSSCVTSGLTIFPRSRKNHTSKILPSCLVFHYVASDQAPFDVTENLEISGCNLRKSYDEISNLHHEEKEKSEHLWKALDAFLRGRDLILPACRLGGFTFSSETLALTPVHIRKKKRRRRRKKKHKARAETCYLLFEREASDLQLGNFIPGVVPLLIPPLPPPLLTFFIRHHLLLLLPPASSAQWSSCREKKNGSNETSPYLSSVRASSLSSSSSASR